MSPSMDAQLAQLRAALAKIARESFDPWAARVARDALATTRPGRVNPLLTWRRLYARPVWTTEDVERAREAGQAAVGLTMGPRWHETQQGVDALSRSLAASIKWVPYWRPLPPDSWGDYPRT